MFSSSNPRVVVSSSHTSATLGLFFTSSVLKNKENLLFDGIWCKNSTKSQENKSTEGREDSERQWRGRGGRGEGVFITLLSSSTDWLEAQQLFCGDLIWEAENEFSLLPGSVVRLKKLFQCFFFLSRHKVLFFSLTCQPPVSVSICLSTDFIVSPLRWKCVTLWINWN